MTAQTASVSLSDVASSNRLDAGFHLATRRAANHLRLFAQLSIEAATAHAHELVAAAPKKVLFAALDPLTRGASPRGSLSVRHAREICSEHPYLALALLHKHLPQIIDHQRTRLDAARRSMNVLTDFASEYPLPVHPVYPGKSARKPGP